MKHNITDGLQVMLAIIITTSLVVVNAAPLPQKQIQKSAVVSPAATQPTETTPPATPQPAQETVPAPETVVDTTPTPAPVETAPVASQPAYTGSHEDWLNAAGIDPGDWWAVDYIVSRESGWDPCAFNPGQSDCSASPVTACGLVQQFPCGKIAGSWTDPVAALVWQKNYVVSRYGGYAQAVAHWKAYQSY